MPTKKPNKNLTLHFAGLLTAYFIWAASAPIIKLTLQSVPPFTFLLFRFIIVGIVLLPYTIITLRRTAIHKDDYSKIVILGLVSQSSLVFIFLGLRFTSAIESTVISLLGPILSVIVGHYLYHEKIDIKIRAGMWLATFGTIFVALEPILNPQEIAADTATRLLGNFFVILYSLSFLLYIIWSKIISGHNTKEVKRTLKFLHMKPMRKRYSPILVTVLAAYVGFATFIPLAVFENAGFFGNYYFSLETLTLTPILGILFMAFFGTIVAYSLFEWSLDVIDVKDTAIFSYLQTIMTFPFAYLLLREVPNNYMVIGGIFIALGVGIAEYRKS